MDMDQAAVWLAGSILFVLGSLVIVAGIIVVNNILHKYWKPVKWAKYEYHPVFYDPQSGEQLIKQPEPADETEKYDTSRSQGISSKSVRSA